MLLLLQIFTRTRLQSVWRNVSSFDVGLH